MRKWPRARDSGFRASPARSSVMLPCKVHRRHGWDGLTVSANCRVNGVQGGPVPSLPFSRPRSHRSTPARNVCGRRWAHRSAPRRGRNDARASPQHPPGATRAGSAPAHARGLDASLVPCPGSLGGVAERCTLVWPVEAVAGFPVPRSASEPTPRGKSLAATCAARRKSSRLPLAAPCAAMAASCRRDFDLASATTA